MTQQAPYQEVLDAAAAQSWLNQPRRLREDPDATAENFHHQPDNVKRYHRRLVAPLVAASLDMLAPYLAGPEGLPGDFYAGQDANADAVRDMAQDIREEVPGD